MTARRKPASDTALTRRRFVTMVAAGSAVLLGNPGLAITRTRQKPAKPARDKAGVAGTKAVPSTPPPTAAQKEFDRQRAGTLATLKTLREVQLPPGGDLPVVFRPRRTPKRGH